MPRLPLVVLMAAGSGLSVASNYYVQPLLPNLADDFAASSSTAGLLVTVSQVGFVIGLALVVPLGDVVERRQLLPWLIALTAGGLALMSAAPGLMVLLALALWLTGLRPSALSRAPS